MISLILIPILVVWCLAGELCYLYSTDDEHFQALPARRKFIAILLSGPIAWFIFLVTRPAPVRFWKWLGNKIYGTVYK